MAYIGFVSYINGEAELSTYQGTEEPTLNPLPCVFCNGATVNGTGKHCQRT